MTGTVAHLVRNWLPHTQTFIHEVVAGADRYRPAVYAEVYLENPSFETACTYLITRSQVDAIEDTNPGFREQFFSELDYPNCFEETCRQQTVSILHAHFGFTGSDSLRLKEETGLPLVTSFYGIDASKYLQDGRTYEKLFDQGDLFLSLGPDMTRRLVSAGCPSDRIRIQPLSIDLDAFAPKEKPEKAGGAPTLLFCGRLIEKKGIRDLIDGYEILIKTHPTARLIIIGEGPLQTWCEHRAYRTKGTIEVLGRQSHETVRDHMRNSDIFVLPSCVSPDGDMEGTPTVLLEAQAMEIPVVSTRHADIPAIVGDGVTGLLVDEHAPQELADALSALIGNSTLASQMGKAGRIRVQGEHDTRQNIQLLEEAYDGLL
jgi:colanic acid/amylovoran biosynthesis glycosyltransferase